MTRNILLIVLLFTMACEREAPFVPLEYTGTEVSGDEMPTHIIRLHPGLLGVEPRSVPSVEYSRAIRTAIEQLFNRLDLGSTAQIEAIYTQLFVGCAVRLTEPELQRLLQQKGVLGVEENSIYAAAQSTSPYKQKTLLDLPEQILPWGVALLNAPGKSSKKYAWILDTGIDLDHPDLNVDVVRSRNFVPWHYREYDADDLNGHGTHIAGVVGALDNTIGVVGIAPGTPVVAVKVLSRNGVGTLSTILEGLEYVLATGQPGDVVNMSFSGRASELLDEAVLAVAKKGIRVVIAAGNNAQDMGGISPARVEGSGVYTVSAIDGSGTFAPFSNFGAGVDFAAPGVQVPSTYRNGGYALLSGTSVAAPHLTGLLLCDDSTSLVKLGIASGDPDDLADPILGIYGALLR